MGPLVIRLILLLLMTKLYSEITIPNAICFSPDAKTAYFTDTATNVLMHVSIDAATGLPISEAKPLLVQERRKGGLDGAIVDGAGDIWIAVWGASSLQKFSPNGELIETVTLPVKQPTCACFIGKDLDQLLVTSAWMGKPEFETTGDHGKTLLVDMPVQGKPEPRIIL